MNRIKTIYQAATLLCTSAVLLLAGCSGDDAPDSRTNRALHFVIGSSQYVDESVAATRGATYPHNYVAYTVPAGENPDFLALIANPKDNPTSSDLFTRRFSFQSADDWQTNITVADTEPEYLIYGFIPLDAENTTDEARITLRDGTASYSQGAKITITGLKVMTTKDPCVIVGVEKAGSKTDDVTLKLGKFGYKFNDEPGNDFAYILLDHIYSQLNFKIKVGAAYAALRTIHVKEMKIEAINSSGEALKSMNATVTIIPNATGDNPVYSVNHDTSVTGGSPMTMYQATDESGLTLTTTEQAIGSKLHVPNNQLRYRLTTTYDVYDNNTPGNLIRKGIEVENTLSLSTMTRGYSYNVILNVTPTYLYVLSDPDLDNPTITVN